MEMKSVKKLVAILGLVLICSGLSTETKTITIGVYNWEPLVSVTQKNHGVLTKIIVSVLKKMGYTVVIKNYPFARIISCLENGEIDISPAISKNVERNKVIDFSSSIYDLEQGVVFKKGRIHFRTFIDLRSYKGGIMRGTFWARELKAAGISYEEVTEQEQNIEKLAANRVDFVCMPKEVAFNIINKLGKDQTKYDFRLLRLEEQPAGISKKTKFMTLRGDFEKGLNIIKRNGTYDKIILKYKKMHHFH